MSSKQETLRKRVYEFYLANKSEGKTYTVNHFKAEGMAKSTIYRIIDSAEKDSGHVRVGGSGRVAKKMDFVNTSLIVDMFDHQDGVSQRQAARDFKCNQSHISKTLKKKCGIRVYKKKKIPKRTDTQRAKIQTLCSRLFQQLQGKSCLMDDESYFTFRHSTINGNGNFYSSDPSATPSNIKCSPRSKFEPKMMIWLCISDKGISKPYFVPSGTAVNQKIYLEECIKKRLIPFIKEHHSDGKYVFWPDLAFTHYLKQ